MRCVSDGDGGKVRSGAADARLRACGAPAAPHALHRGDAKSADVWLARRGTRGALRAVRPVRLRLHHRRSGALAILASALAAGTAGATIPDASGVIHGCYNPALGTVRVI